MRHFSSLMSVIALAAAALMPAACASSPQASSQPSRNAPEGTLGQGRTSAAAAMYKSAATSEKDATLAPETQAAGSLVTVPFALWNVESKSWQIPTDKDGKPFMVTATAVRDFTYVVAGSVANSATVSGTASGTQTQGGSAGASSGQTATPTNTTNTNPTVTPR